jgi:NAD(P)-dependent dehydrogenase (short-subunit alcohol dehydrogenase family)
MAAQPLTKRNALVLGVARPAGRAAAVALAEAGADVAAVTISEDTKAEFAANSVANELWAIGRKGVVLTSDGSAPAVQAAIAAATAELGPLSIAVCNVPVPLPRDVFAGLRSDPAIVVLVGDDAPPADARALLAWTRELADGGLRANALVASCTAAEALGPALKEHHPPEPLDLARAVVYLASDASAAVEGALVVADAP